MALALRSFQKAVTTAGTPVQLTAGPINAKWVRITAKCALTTSYMYIGNNGSGTVSAALGDALLSGQSVIFGGVDAAGNAESLDLSTIFVDSDANGDKVTVSYIIQV